MAIDKAVDSGALDTMFTNIGNAIREKDGSTDPITPGNMPAKIRAIQTGYDTSDATVTASDMPEGVIGYGASGKVTGNVFELGSGYAAGGTLNEIANTGSNISVNASFPFDTLARKGSAMLISLPYASFGTATAADVAKGKTFTSAAGFKVVGTMEPIALSAIAVSSSKTEYGPGDSFDASTLAVTATYTNGATKALSAGSYTVTAPDLSTTGEKTGSVSYTEGGVTKTASFTVTVAEQVAADVITYTGTMTDQIVLMSNVAYRLLTLTSSGTLTFNKARKGDVWMVAGGNVGNSSGGAGGYAKQANAVQLSGDIAAIVGAGATYTKGVDSFGGGSSFGTVATTAPHTSGNVNSGGTGGGGNRAKSTFVGTGDGGNKYPFGNSSGAQLKSSGAVVTGTNKPHSGGGGGAGRTENDEDLAFAGGKGGTNGGNGAVSSGTPPAGGDGGDYGGGKGGDGERQTEAANGADAYFYGAGGGAYGVFYTSSGKEYLGSAGDSYQGVIYVRIPLDQSIYN